MDISKVHFHRLFSKTMYKNLKIPLGEMTFTKDFVNDNRGDLYPIINKSSNCAESIADNKFLVKAGSVERLLGSFFPYATYEMTFSVLEGSCGLSFHIPSCCARISYDNEKVLFSANNKEELIEYKNNLSCTTMIVSCRPGAFDVYFLNHGQPQFLHTFLSENFADSNAQKIFQKGYVSVLAKGKVTVEAASFYIDCGVSQADIRPICYENGDVIYENGKVFLSFSIRRQEGTSQGIFSWIPGTSKFEFTGALFFDSGDGCWRDYLASSILYNRPTNEWYLWVSSFAHKHVLGHSAFKGDPRFGVNVIDVTIMNEATGNDITEFAGFRGDEDPDFYYNEQEKKWYMAICRPDPTIKSYRYVFFKSDKPFEDYTYVGKGYDGAETGGSFVSVGDEKIFACGNAFDKRANYRIYTNSGMYEAKFDFDDGGFRGWGTIIPVEMGSRKRYFWLTFDRHNGSNYNWSYGNVYCFEAENEEIL